MAHKTLKRGDHIYVDYGAFIHHGIYYGSEKVIHYFGGKICKDPLYKFSRGRSIFIKNYHRCSSPGKVIWRAKKRLGEDRYNFLFNNCEHFAIWCKTGRSRCKQVEELDKTLPKLVSYYHRRSFGKLTREVSRLFKGRFRYIS